MRHLYTLLTFTLIVPAGAQTALLREGDPSPDGTANQTITNINIPIASYQDGYACSLTTAGVNGTLSQFFGSLTGGVGAFLREETTIGNFE